MKFNPNSKEYVVESISSVVAARNGKLGYLFANGAFEPVCETGAVSELPVIEKTCEVLPLHEFLGYDSRSELVSECFRELSTGWVDRLLESKLDDVDDEVAESYRSELSKIYNSFNREY